MWSIHGEIDDTAGFLDLSAVGDEVLVVVGARGGSKSLPGKNIAPLCGKPLIAWTIEAATGSRSVTRTIVTTDDEEIAETARRCGAEIPFTRPASLAQDHTPGIDVVLHAVRWLDDQQGYRPDIVVHLQPTSPLRASSDIDDAITLLVERDADAVVGVTHVKHHPWWMKKVDQDGWMHDFVPQSAPTANRQELPPVYSVNGAIYLARLDVLIETGGWYTLRTSAYVMPAERSVDIDTWHDLAVAELLLEAASA
jgi:N-acylneuraminate cytidylyltransferase/CMP-N,N'-diacetyllegionaminic acid synthase